jgi:hypothetical protein
MRAMTKHKLPLRFPTKLTMGELPKHRRALIAGGHLALAINPLTIFTGGLPLAGTLAAVALFVTARMHNDGLEIDAIKQGFGRVGISISLLFMCILSIQTADWLIWPAQAWVAMALVQTPLGLYDAWSIWQGRLGLTVKGLEKF